MKNFSRRKKGRTGCKVEAALKSKGKFRLEDCAQGREIEIPAKMETLANPWLRPAQMRKETP